MYLAAQPMNTRVTQNLNQDWQQTQLLFNCQTYLLLPELQRWDTWEHGFTILRGLEYEGRLLPLLFFTLIIMRETLLMGHENFLGSRLILQDNELPVTRRGQPEVKWLAVRMQEVGVRVLHWVTGAPSWPLESFLMSPCFSKTWKTGRAVAGCLPSLSAPQPLGIWSCRRVWGKKQPPFQKDINTPAPDTDICRFHLLWAGGGREEESWAFTVWSTEEKN